MTKILIDRAVLEQALKASVSCYGTGSDCSKALDVALDAKPVEQTDWQEMYLREKRHSEMWTKKYVAIGGKVEYAYPLDAAPVEQDDLVQSMHLAAAWFPGAAPLIREAATRIEALTAENAALLAANRDCVDHFNSLRADHDKATKALDVALEALENADWYIGQLELIAYASDDSGTHSCRAKVHEAINKLKELRHD